MLSNHLTLSDRLTRLHEIRTLQLQQTFINQLNQIIQAWLAEIIIQLPHQIQMTHNILQPLIADFSQRIVVMPNIDYVLFRHRLDAFINTLIELEQNQWNPVVNRPRPL